MKIILGELQDELEIRNKVILVTGVTGFIGSRLSICSLLNENKGERLNESCNYNALL